MNTLETKLASVVEATAKDRDLAGVVVRVEQPEQSIAWTGSRGNLSADSKFFIASTTKLYTSAIAQRMIDRGDLSLGSRRHRYVAFLRAINTPPRYVRMDRIRSAFQTLDFENVRTVIPSGNVVFDSTHACESADRIEAALQAELGFDVLTFLRTSAEVVNIVADAPFPRDHGHIEVSFLVGKPERDAARVLESTASGTNRLAVHGTEVYWWRQGSRAESAHNEATVARVLGMTTTRRTLRTISRIVNTHLRHDKTSQSHTSA